jgi:penicillin-binding protein 2
VVPGPVYHRAVGKAKFTDALTAQTSIGQYDTLASPLQMCAVQATVANGGISYVPTFVHHRWDPLTNKSTSFTPKIRANLLENGVKKSQIDKIRRGEWEVVNAQGGTGSRYRSSLPIIKDNGGGAGKTGTAQFKRAGQKDNHTWFIGFAPFDKPKLAVCVLVQGGNAGGTCAAPVAKRITERILMLQSGQYEIDPSGIRNVKEAKGHFKYIDAVTYSDENPADIEPVQDDVDSDESEAREVEVAPAKPKNTSAEPTFRTETDSQIQRARVIEKPKFIPNKQSQP